MRKLAARRVLGIGKREVENDIEVVITHNGLLNESQSRIVIKKK